MKKSGKRSAGEHAEQLGTVYTALGTCTEEPPWKNLAGPQKVNAEAANTPRFHSQACTRGK